jgi:predicted ATP-dependent serine protease
MVHPNAIKIAAAIEILHLGTLVHDDIIYNAELRRGDVTLQKKYGKRTAVICGDYLLTVALRMAGSIENKKDYLYDTGMKDEFARPISVYAPTVIILDSIPTMSSKDASDSMEGGTYSNRVAKALAQFYKRLMPIIKAYNITVIAINHINQKIEINPRQLWGNVA